MQTAPRQNKEAEFRRNKQSSTSPICRAEHLVIEIKRLVCACVSGFLVQTQTMSTCNRDIVFLKGRKRTEIVFVTEEGHVKYRHLCWEDSSQLCQQRVVGDEKDAALDLQSTRHTHTRCVETDRPNATSKTFSHSIYIYATDVPKNTPEGKSTDQFRLKQFFFAKALKGKQDEHCFDALERENDYETSGKKKNVN